MRDGVQDNVKQFSVAGLLKVTFVVAALLLLAMSARDLGTLSSFGFLVRLLAVGVAGWLIPDLLIQWLSKAARK